MTTIPSTGLQYMKEKMEKLVLKPSFSSALNEHHVFIFIATFHNASQLNRFIMTILAGNRHNVKFTVIGLVVFMWE